MSDLQDRKGLIAGGILILLGIAFFFLQFAQGFGQAIISLLVGALFVGGYLYTRSYALLIPGAILMGLGIGHLADTIFFMFNGLTTIGLGLGFCAIYVIDYFYRGRTHWWPLIPGVILIVLGLFRAVLGLASIFAFLLPLILIAIGLFVLASAFGLTGRWRGWQ